MPDDMRHEQDYIDRTIATIRIHKHASNSWPQWANILADHIEDQARRLEWYEKREQGWRHNRCPVCDERDELARRLEAAEGALRNASVRLGELTQPPFIPGYTYLVAEVRDQIRAALREGDAA